MNRTSAKRRKIWTFSRAAWSAPASERVELPKLRKLVLGPFHSDLNPIGVMSADFVAGQILWQAEIGLPLIIVTPNPATLLVMPLVELGRLIYNRMFRISRRDP